MVIIHEQTDGALKVNGIILSAIFTIKVEFNKKNVKYVRY